MNLIRRGVAAGAPLVIAACSHVPPSLDGDMASTHPEALRGDAALREPETQASIARVLDDFHDAAARADGERYFGHLAPDAVFLGTDATERWTVPEFRVFAMPYFERGTGWAYVATSRNVVVARDGAFAWFDELLENEKYGQCRGAGTMVRRDGAWKIAQYSLSIPVPNELALSIVEMIRKAED